MPLGHMSPGHKSSPMLGPVPHGPTVLMQVPLFCLDFWGRQLQDPCCVLFSSVWCHPSAWACSLLFSWSTCLPIPALGITFQLQALYQDPLCLSQICLPFLWVGSGGKTAFLGIALGPMRPFPGLHQLDPPCTYLGMNSLRQHKSETLLKSTYTEIYNEYNQVF